MTAFLGGVVASATTENSSKTEQRSETSIHLLLKGIFRLTVILGGGWYTVSLSLQSQERTSRPRPHMAYISPKAAFSRLRLGSQLV